MPEAETKGTTTVPAPQPAGPARGDIPGPATGEVPELAPAGENADTPAGDETGTPAAGDTASPAAEGRGVSAVVDATTGPENGAAPGPGGAPVTRA
ncbi:hypothetical protein ABZ871_26090, partial [Streptomyces populi]